MRTYSAFSWLELNHNCKNMFLSNARFYIVFLGPTLLDLQIALGHMSGCLVKEAKCSAFCRQAQLLAPCPDLLQAARKPCFSSI